MDEKEKINKVPGFWLSTYLFIFFYLLLRTIFTDIPQMYYTMVDAAIAEDEPIVLTCVFACFNIIMICFSFWSIIRVLKHSKDSISSIRWALSIYLIVLLYELLQTIGHAILVHWAYSLGPALKLIVVCAFLIYLWKSRVVKDLFPLSGRKFLPGGLLWLVYLIMFVLFFGYVGYVELQKNDNSKKIDNKTLSLDGTYISDGMMAFKSDKSWRKSYLTLNALDMDDYKITVFKSIDDSTQIAVWCGLSEKTRRMDFTNILLQCRPDSVSKVLESYSCDTIIDGNQYYVDQYIYRNDSVMSLWTIGVRFDNNSYKYCAMSRYGKLQNTGNEQDKAFLFLKSVKFNLSKFLK